LSNVRGRGLFCAFDCPDGDVRDRLLTSCFEHHVLALSCGDRSIRMRPALTLTSEEAAEGVKRIGSALDTVTSGK
jgi:L-lysine 6-transaminase